MFYENSWKSLLELNDKLGAFISICKGYLRNIKSS